MNLLTDALRTTARVFIDGGRVLVAHWPELVGLFLAGWAGGPRDWFEAHPGKCMMSMHAPFPIGRQTADQWAEAMTRAIAETELADREIADAMADVLGRMARGMARS